MPRPDPIALATGDAATRLELHLHRAGGTVRATAITLGGGEPMSVLVIAFAEGREVLRLDYEVGQVVIQEYLPEKEPARG